MNRREYEERIAKLEKELDELKKMEIKDDGKQKSADDQITESL